MNGFHRKTKVLLVVIAISSLLYSQSRNYSPFYYQRVSLFERLPVGPSDIVFLGNSITNGGEWAELFNDSRVKNRGISGDICVGVYDRLNPILSGKPAKLFLMIGINDMARDTSPDTIVARTGIILDKILSESPATRIYLQSILPVNEVYGMFEGHTKHREKIRPLNARLQQLAESKGITYIDLFSHFVEPGTDKMDPAYSNDGLHLMGEGYMKWVEVVGPYINDTCK